ncbi:MAG: hypothetical protein ACRCYU_15785, partial [Nocardioides sp.]
MAARMMAAQMMAARMMAAQMMAARLRANSRMSGRRLAVGATAVLALSLTGCGSAVDSSRAGGAAEGGHTAGSHSPAPSHGESDHSTGNAVEDPVSAPLRDGEAHQTIAMPEEYTPAAPTGVGTDDYRCFMLDPKLDRDVFLTGTHVLPGNPEVVHHVILFRVPPEQVPVAEEVDAGEAGPGWTCFGDTRLGTGPQMDDAPWLGAWAPGGGEAVYGKDLGVPLAKGSRIIMQVHYNLLAGKQ